MEYNTLKVPVGSSFPCFYSSIQQRPRFCLSRLLLIPHNVISFSQHIIWPLHRQIYTVQRPYMML